MPVSFVPSQEELLRIAPEIILTLAGTLIMVLTPFARGRTDSRFGYICLGALLAAMVAALAADQHRGAAFHQMLEVDGFATFFRILVLGVGLLTALSSLAYLRREQAEPGEYYALLLYSVAGQSLMAAANELIMIFIGLEISSIASYILAGYLREDLRATEAALKYFLLGSFATAFLLYGVAWIYGMTGSTHLAEIRASLTVAAPAPSELLVAVAAAMMFAGLAFKVSAWPFQVWAPDVYQGAPAPVAAFLSAGPKAAAFAVFLRIFLTAFEPAATRWAAFVWWSALVSMTLGNLAALVQSNIKRLLAYSSIAHAGYVLVALTAHSEAGASAVMFYLAAYALMNIGAFAMVAHFSRKGERYVEVDDFAGLAVTHPAAASLFAIFLLSLIGVPPTAGFFAKFYVFKAALDADLVGLTVLGLLNSAVGAYYYLRILVVMYMREPGEAAAAAPSLPPSLKATLWICAVGTMLLGVWPTLLLGFADRAAAMVR
ncbi:MAG: NADH-quinone oxidoreductase subunit N [Bryobacteraceae bacterium]|nr:NADH-quinone oxidoreductase subunit N [Bryobacteraceae bacterium]